MNNLNEIKGVFEADKEVKLAYLFGSRASGETGPLSDYDFAVYLDSKDSKRNFNKKIELQNNISKILKTDNVDIVVLDNTKAPELKYSIITIGKLIKEVEPFKLIVEPQIMNEYFDFHAGLLRYNLTSA